MNMPRKVFKKIAVVGAGFSGAVVAHELSKAGFEVDIFDERDHIAGNCHTSRDKDTGILLHIYGPHIFHTNNEIIWNYINQFDEFIPFVNRVKAISNGNVYSLPINLLTINNFFKKCLSPSEAMGFINNLSIKSIENPLTFEEQALKFIGHELYEAFFKGYTQKQWGVHPSELPAAILKRLPIRFNYDDNYYSSKYQGLPKNGYTSIVFNMLKSESINLLLKTKFTRSMSTEYAHVFYSGPIDAWFDHCQGYLGYRTLDFHIEKHHGDFQGNAVINYCDPSTPWTRITEHKHFSPWENHIDTIIYREFSRNCEHNDTPYYPIRLTREKKMLSDYINLARQEKNVTFMGRLGTYRYLDMHITIAEALDVANNFKNTSNNNLVMPAFLINPLE